MVGEAGGGSGEGSAWEEPRVPLESARSARKRPKARLLGEDVEASWGTHDDSNDDAILVQNCTYRFKLHPDGKIHPIGL